MNTNSKIPTITIEEVAQSFANWRATKTRKNQPIPDELRRLVKQLIPFYKKNTILSSFKLSKFYSNIFFNAPPHF